MNMNKKLPKVEALGQWCPIFSNLIDRKTGVKIRMDTPLPPERFSECLWICDRAITFGKRFRQAAS